MSQYSSGMKRSISSSRSQTIRSATDWTRPAESPRWTLYQRSGLSSYPTSRSSTRRACWASTSSIFIVSGSAMALFTPCSVISCILMRHCCRVSMSSREARCQAIASPSRSGSEASSVRLLTAEAPLSVFIRSALPRTWIYSGSKSCSMSIARRPFGRSRTCPTLASTL